MVGRDRIHVISIFTFLKKIFSIFRITIQMIKVGLALEYFRYLRIILEILGKFFEDNFKI